MISTCISFMTLVKYRRIVLRSLSVQRHDSKEFILNFITDEGDHRYCDVPYYPLIIKRIKDHVFKKLQQYKSQNITLGIDMSNPVIARKHTIEFKKALTTFVKNQSKFVSTLSLIHI